MDPLDVLPEAVLVLDDEHRVVRGNDRVAAVLGARDVEPGTPVGELVAWLGETGAPCPDPVPARGVGERIAEQALHVRLPDGRERAVAMAGRWQPDGGVVLTFRRRHAGSRGDAAVADVLATLAHELRSPLTSVKGFTRTLLDRWGRFSDEQKHTMLQTIEADTERVTRLLAELVDVGRLESGRVQLSRQPVDLAALVHEVVAKARVRPDGRDRDVPVTVAQDAPADVPADRDKVEQVLTNLLDNALRHAPDSEVRVHVDGGAGEVRVVVADDGPGIPADEHAQVFARFGRGGDVRAGGTGLGLHLARGLARAHGGDVTLRSAAGQGAAFTLSLPRGDEHA